MPPPLPRCSRWACSSLVSPNRVSLPRFHVRIGLHIVLFEVCSAFTRVAACTLARSPYVVTPIRRLQTLRLLHVCSGRFRLERSPGGACTHWKSAALSRRTWKLELLARAVAPDGKVYAQNSEAAFAPVKDRLDARLKTPATANIVSVVRPFEDPGPPGMHDFDLVTFFYAYHDITYLGVDRAKMNKAFYDALKPGGELVVGDYSAEPGASTSVVQTLHRSDEALVTSEIEAAGFKLIDHGDFLRVSGDARDAPSHSSAQPVDIYVL